MVFCFADELRHGAHRAVDAPGTGPEQRHRDQAQDGRGEHHAVKPKGKLCYPGRANGDSMGPFPGQADAPQQLDAFL